MTVFLRIDINIAAMALLAMVFLIAYKELDREDILSKKFLSTSLIIIFGIFVETMTCLINRNPNDLLIPVSVFLHECLFITSPILAYSWYAFIYSWVISGGTIQKSNNILLMIPVLVNLVLTILSPYYGFIFYVDSSNIYHRGRLFIVAAGIAYFYLLFTLLLIIRHRRKMIKQEFTPLFLFGIFPMLGGFIQTLFYGVLLMWSSAAFSLIIVYIYLQKRLIHLDNLTGSWTRGSFDYYISQRIKQRGSFGIAYIDLDGLKQINDQYGHAEGDFAIKKTVNLIRESLRKADIIARLGGDEFVVLMDSESKEYLEKTVARINSSFTEYNSNSTKNYKLECSIGADIFDANFTSIEQFLHHVDTLMYENKRKKKMLQVQ